MDQGCPNMENGPLWPGGEVPDKIHPWNGPTSVPKCCRPRPQEKYRPLPGSGVPPRCNPNETSMISQNMHMYPDPLAQEAAPKVHSFRIFLTGGDE